VVAVTGSYGRPGAVTGSAAAVRAAARDGPDGAGITATSAAAAATMSAYLTPCMNTAGEA